MRSLWLVPPSPLFESLKATIDRLSERFSTPRFDPHVTLLGNLAGTEDEILGNASQLAARLPVLAIRLTTLDGLPEYFRCLFIHIEKTRRLSDAHRLAREIFAGPEGSTFMPHLSLMYGDLPASAKKTIIAEMGSDFSPSFDATSLHVFATDGEPKDWYRVGEFGLTGAAHPEGGNP